MAAQVISGPLSWRWMWQSKEPAEWDGHCSFSHRKEEPRSSYNRLYSDKTESHEAETTQPTNWAFLSVTQNLKPLKDLERSSVVSCSSTRPSKVFFLKIDFCHSQKQQQQKISDHVEFTEDLKIRLTCLPQSFSGSKEPIKKSFSDLVSSVSSAASSSASCSLCSAAGSPVFLKSAGFTGPLLLGWAGSVCSDLWSPGGKTKRCARMSTNRTSNCTKQQEPSPQLSRRQEICLLG